MDNNNIKYWFIFCGGSLLLKSNEDGEKTIPLSCTPPTKTHDWTVIQELPDIDGTPCYCYSIATPPMNEEGWHTMRLRDSYNILSFRQYSMAGKASELLYWESNTKYCGVCGGMMKRNSIISKKCTNCGKEVWPQVAPAIIVRVERDDKILMVRAKNFSRNYYGLVAGFLETGETLEECVKREVMEETNIKIDDIKYFGSQPWPYPCGVMIGFTAKYVGGEIKLQEEELVKGDWFSRNNLPNIPEKLSIARMLIDDWIEQEK